MQVNTGEEPQKGGVAPADLAAFLTFCKTRQLNISGLMCLPPHGQPAAPHFAWLRQAAQEHGLTELSCGMSQDWQEAVALGATCVRLGTALFETSGRETGGRETSEQQTGERENWQAAAWGDKLTGGNLAQGTILDDRHNDSTPPCPWRWNRS